MTEVIATKQAPAAVGPYSQAIKAGDFLFASGQIGLMPATGELAQGGITAQAQQAMKNVSAVLAEAGLSFDNVIKTTVFITDMADFAAVNEVYGSCFQKMLPARSCVAIKELPKGALVEVEVIAYCK